MSTITLNLSELSCNHCVATVKKALTAVAGVTEVDVTLKQAVITGEASVETLINTIESVGYKATLADSK